MKFACIIICLLWLGSASCMNGASSKQLAATPNDTLSYSYQKIKKRAPDCGTKADTDCTVVNIIYPLFKAQKVLNDTVQFKLSALFELDDQKKLTADQLAGNFIKMYDKNKKSDREKMSYTLDISTKVLHQDSSLIVLSYSGYVFDGGAHGSSQTIFINWNTKKSKKIVLDDIFVEGYQENLNKIAEKIFRTDEKLSDTTSLATNYFFDKNKFSLNKNFMVTPQGVSFLYNEYEIKPYSAGQTTLLIPYSQIKSLLRPATVVSQYLR